MSPHVVATWCERLFNSYKKDYIEFMRDMNRDMENEMKGQPKEVIHEVILIVNTSLLAMWLAVEVAHLTPQVAEFMLGNLIKEINEATPHLRQALKQIEEANE